MGRTSHWVKGASIVTRKPRVGYVIATFNSNDKYSGHVAVVLAVKKNYIVVVDQNWDDKKPLDYKSVGQIYIHAIDFKGAGVENAGNYYIVRYP